MTLDDLAQLTRPFATVEDVGSIIGIRPYTLRLQARNDPTRLGFPVCVAGNTVRIPREAFINWMLGRGESAQVDPRSVYQGENPIYG